MDFLDFEEMQSVSGGDGGYGQIAVGSGMIVGSTVIAQGSVVTAGGALGVAGVGAGGVVTGIGAVPIATGAMAAYGGYLVGDAIAQSPAGPTLTTIVGYTVGLPFVAAGYLWGYYVD